MKAQLRNVSFAILLSLLLLTCSCSIDKSGQALKTDDTAKSKSAKFNDANASFDDLTRSKFCADAAEAFWKHHDWKNEKDPLDQTTYTSHYNNSMNKCLVTFMGLISKSKRERSANQITFTTLWRTRSSPPDGRSRRTQIPIRNQSPRC
jgi:hypothetical protein